MKKINLVIASNNLEYLEYLLSYLRESEYADSFIIKTFSKSETLIEFLQANNQFELLLVEPHLLPQNIILANTIIIQLLDNPQTNIETSYHTMYKYQPLNLLFSQIAAIYSEANGQVLKNIDQNREKRVISVYSTTGGVGKSTIAINLAREAAYRGKKVFYLNLEWISTTASFFSMNNTNDFSKVIYYLKSNNGQLNSKLSGFRKFDPTTKIEYFEPVLNPNELLDLTVEDIQILIDGLLEVGGYEIIVIDLDSTLNDYVVGAFNRSNNIIWALLDNPIYIHKTEQLFNQLKQLFKNQYTAYEQKFVFILNRHLGSIRNDFTDLNLSINPSIHLPYVPEWKFISDIDQLYASEQFNQQIQKLYNTLSQANPLIGVK